MTTINATKVVRYFLKSAGTPISASANLQPYEIAAYRVIAKNQYGALDDQVAASLNPNFWTPATIPVPSIPGHVIQNQPVIYATHSPIPAALIAQINAYNALP